MRVNKHPHSKKTEAEKQAEVLAALRAFYKENNRPPTRSDMGERFRSRAIHAFGTWDKAIVAAIGIHARWRKQSDEELLNIIRDYHKKHSRIPTGRQIGRSAANVISNRFGSWNKAIAKALNIQIVSRETSNEELLAQIKTLHAKLGQIPSTAELKGLRTILWQRFGSVSNAIEQAIRTSMRLEALKALRLLTPPSCDVATAIEISHELQKQNIKLAPQQVGAIMEDCQKDGIVSRGTTGMRTCWSLTTHGREFLKNFK